MCSCYKQNRKCICYRSTKIKGIIKSLITKHLRKILVLQPQYHDPSTESSNSFHCVSTEIGIVKNFLKLSLENKLPERNHAEGIIILHQKPQKYYCSNMYFSYPFNRHVTSGSKQGHTKMTLPRL